MWHLSAQAASFAGRRTKSDAADMVQQCGSVEVYCTLTVWQTSCAANRKVLATRHGAPMVPNGYGDAIVTWQYGGPDVLRLKKNSADGS